MHCLAGWCINVTHASTVGRQIYDTLGTCTFLSLHCSRLLTFCQSVCCYGNTPLPFSDQNPNLNPLTLHLPLSPHRYSSSCCSLSLCLFRPHSFPLFIYDSMHCLVTWTEMFRSKKGQHRLHTYTSTQTLDCSLSPTSTGNVSFGKQEKAACCLEEKRHFCFSHFIKATQINR